MIAHILAEYLVFLEFVGGALLFAASFGSIAVSIVYVLDSEFTLSRRLAIGAVAATGFLIFSFLGIVLLSLMGS